MKFSNNLIMGLLAILAGILVIVMPELIRWIVGIFLIVWGILVLIGQK